jgi:hypothetical protein
MWQEPPPPQVDLSLCNTKRNTIILTHFDTELILTKYTCQCVRVNELGCVSQ